MNGGDLRFWRRAVLALVGGMAAVSEVQAISTPYAGEIEHRQAVVRILERSDVIWDGVPAPTELQFEWVTASADGSRVFFNVRCPYCPGEAGYSNRPFIADSGGGGLEDVSDLFPADLVSAAWSWGNMRINDDGSWLFIETLNNSGYNHVYYRDNHSRQVAKACTDDFDPATFDWFGIDGTGAELYLGEYDAGWSEALQRNRRGLFYADVGGPAEWYFDIHGLPCTEGCDDLNMMSFMGNAAEADRSFFLWNSDEGGWHCTGDGCLHNALWYADLDGSAAKVTDEEHYWASGGDWRGISTADGERVLYLYTELPGEPMQANLVHIPTGAETPVTWTSDLNGFDPLFVTPSGRKVFVRGTAGDHGYHYHTLFDTLDGSRRDTWSYYIPAAWHLSGMAEDRYYFATHADALYRVDTAPSASADYGAAPRVGPIAFDAPALWHGDGGLIGVSARVSDAQGAADIEWVRLVVLVDGMEAPPFYMARAPLAYPAGDWSSNPLYDDGTHGDDTAGDGLFTFDQVATRKGDYDGMNTWFNEFDLPHEVGVRIIAKDLAGNYGFADTTLTILDEPCQTGTLSLSNQTISVKRTLCAEDSVELGPGLAAVAGADLYVTAPKIRLLPDSHLEFGAQARLRP